MPHVSELFHSGTSQVPVSLAFENQRGFKNYDPDFPIEKIKKELPPLVLEHTKVKKF